MAGIVVLQARTGSSRLPAKVLLPVGGRPLAVLAAERAANTGRQVIVATSVEPEDDALARVLQGSGIACFRGSRDNVLQRMVEAVAGHADDTPLIRLTADNAFPDGRLLDEVEDDFLARGLDYLACNGASSGVPYGVSCEITRVGHLREALRQATDAHDLEHVTPWVIRRFGAAWFERYRALGKGHYRCTVDTFDDYLEVERVFAGVADPVRASLTDLIARLEGGRWQPAASRPAAKLVVGTAQLGLPYGIANATGMPAAADAAALLKICIANGAAWVDTAQAYGRSEAVVGEALATGWKSRVRVATKLSPLADSAPDADPSCVRAAVEASIFASCARLRVQQLDAVLLHRAAHLRAWNGAAWETLLRLRREGVIASLGVSVQDPEELQLALQFAEVGIVQMPYNLLDWRWDASIDMIRARKDSGPLVVHVRSALLQGLLCSRDAAHWRRAHVADAPAVWNWLDAQREAHGCADVAALCLGHVRSQPWVDGVVVGMETLAQARANIAHFSAPPLAEATLASLAGTRPRLPEAALNPARWLPADAR